MLTLHRCVKKGLTISMPLMHAWHAQHIHCRAVLAADTRAVAAVFAHTSNILLLFFICTSHQVAAWTFPNPVCNVPDFEVTDAYDVQDTSAFAFVGLDHAHSAIVTAFQGTLNQVNWITNLSTWFTYNDEVSGSCSLVLHCWLAALCLPSPLHEHGSPLPRLELVR